MIQIKLFEDEPKPKKQILIVGGIYREDDDEPDYDGCYALCMGSDQFYFLFDGIMHIEEICELIYAHKMRLVKGYALAVKRENGKCKWLIRNSSKKNCPDYILAQGTAGDGFWDSLDKFRKVFHK